MPKTISVSFEVWDALMNHKTRNMTFDDVLRDLLEELGECIDDTYDGVRI